MTDQTNEEKTQAALGRLETILPRAIDTLIDILDGRKFLAVVTTRTPDGKFITTMEIADNSDAPAPVDDSAPPAAVFYQGATQPR